MKYFHLVTMTTVIVTSLTKIEIWASQTMKPISLNWRLPTIITKVSITRSNILSILESIHSSTDGERLWLFDDFRFGYEIESFAFLEFRIGRFEYRLVGFVHDKTLNALDGLNSFQLVDAAIWWYFIQFEI